MATDGRCQGRDRKGSPKERQRDGFPITADATMDEIRQLVHAPVNWKLLRAFRDPDESLRIRIPVRE